MADDPTPPLSAPTEAAPDPATPTAPEPAAAHHLAAGHHHHGHAQLPPLHFIEELKRRNVGRVAVLYVVVSYVVLEVFEMFFHLLEMPPWTGRAAVLIAVLGFPITLLIAWAYEITPEGLKPTDEVPAKQSIGRQTGKRLDRAIVALMAIALGYFVVDKFWLSKHAGAAETANVAEHVATSVSTASVPTTSSVVPVAVNPVKSVAVLPFLDMSEKHDQEYFSDGLSEELIDKLVRVPDLRVPARTSSFYFKGKQVTIKDIAAALGVAHVLEGSVRKSGNTLRITAQLIRVDNGYHVWSESYDRKVDDIFKMQDEIAGAVVAALKLSLLTETSPKGVGTSNVAAYDLYLQARAIYFRAGLRSDYTTMIAYLERSLKSDPDFAPAWALLSVAQAILAGNHTDTAQEERRGFEDARHSARQALALDDKLPEAHTAMGRVLFNADQNWEGALLETRRAMALDPGNAYALYWMGNVLTALGNVTQAIEFYEKSIARDPLNPHVYRNLAGARHAAGQYAAAEDAYHKVLELNPNEYGIHFSVGALMLSSSRASEALAEFERADDIESRLQGRALALYALGRKAEGDAAITALESAYGDTAPYDIAQVRAFRGENALAFAALGRVRGPNLGSFWTVKTDPLLKNLHSDPRFAVFLKTMNLSP